MIGSSSFSSNVVGSGQATGTGRLLFLKGECACFRQPAPPIFFTTGILVQNQAADSYLYTITILVWHTEIHGTRYGTMG
jgi:hypothetical protein